mmetsp:Transcript_21067/g.41753  ORF Transcript_21067/g.41753 Transcript_21067/m.41753 type:complete len:377 (+) Transcript_21067:83-1213(+)
MEWNLLFILATVLSTADCFLPTRIPPSARWSAAVFSSGAGGFGAKYDTPREIKFQAPSSTTGSDIVLTSGTATVTSTVVAPAAIPTPRLITFDAVGTLIQHRGPVGMDFRQVLFKYSELRLPRPEIFNEAFKEIYGAKLKSSPCFGCGESVSSTDWWREVVTETYLEVGVPQAVLDEYMEDVFAELYYECLTGAEGWELTPEANYVLTEMQIWRKALGNQAPKLGVISNFDERLGYLLDNLGIGHHFEFVLTSKECGIEKPSRQIYDIALTRCGIYDRAHAVHIGSDFEEDTLGAASAGWQSVFLKPPPFSAAEPNPKNAIYQRVGSLIHFLDVLGIETDPRRLVYTTINRGIYEQDNLPIPTLPDAYDSSLPENQ